ncbi:MAG: DUF4198 domain-containing protein [Proteobacteria bacterium]|nr:DUF4198 domain-containing protein [Pseudomonadota bacterium]MBU1687434.1 DUF4198 domain-containing protein [Pseudomonadota bacterium]
MSWPVGQFTLALLVLAGTGLVDMSEVGATPSSRLPPLRLQLAPATPTGEVCDSHGPAAPPNPGKKGRGGKGGGRPVSESEHQPQPERTYYLSNLRRLAQVTALVRRPDGSLLEPTLQLGVDPKLSFATPMGDGPIHGANTVYVMEQGVEEGTLVVRIAQWITMHHNCGWGHEHKFDEHRTQPQPLSEIPLEIVANDLWDTNFHSKVTSGQALAIRVLHNGQPVEGARITVTTEQQWRKEVTTDDVGRATVQLIRDYYPSSWTDFNRTKRSSFLLTATFETNQPGTFQGVPYERATYVTTLPWHYSPAQADYSSRLAGLTISLVGLTLTGGGVFFYRERRKKPSARIVFDE